ncbi:MULTISPECIES: MerR family transcriptional regulator [unclassified Rhizobium]|uniref:MerR family transcriptional regulator n=1 Tax=unclassified Rhizobium TaxID=2613769 RepID=UPI001AE70524|nr:MULTISPECIES: MerR family transcriptional regulator [unclassified Rhizobium]MBP2461395.1 DNA-binding transcriptional MerR regulator [Rhizobium sp. PvP014]MBP2528791.1 DNA-binding transcriptional MerR regulator [Rhizobium sp. PvP099]
MRSDLFDAPSQTSQPSCLLSPEFLAIRFFPQIQLPFELPDQPVPIADVADLFGVTHRTLHFYEEKGLLVAGRATGRGTAPMRVYASDQIRRMAVITACREVGIGIVMIQDLLSVLAGAASQAEADDIFSTALQQRKREMTAEISQIRRQMQQIETLVSQETDDRAETSRRAACPPLADIERRCLSLMSDGYSASRIARELEIDLDEMRRIEIALIDKFEASNRFQAIAKALVAGVVLN